MTKKDHPPDLSDLQKRIAAAREREQAANRPDAQKRAMASGYGMAIRLAVEMVAALGVSVFLGIWIDGELGTAPLFIMIFLVMGMGAGFINVYKTVSGFSHGSLRDPKSGKKDGTTRGD
ncbi:MAG: AtpZ/AtpI family protein [Alphaproteobacteria bacterium]|jgi:ATP synthase protein I|nr:AtpZ/AtpI family protein [Rhodospirillaceae bacterium]MBT6204863.1 AtpZ/AtpI family protein [Rhodospirillaceae bacterium]MBT7613915.1 AtpZ/AtpI family protein [Rhodospirillaceae bacterium]MBT7647289.1 AtpZ/AtpI family protein [Rhodospirillaceae bacterium]MDG2480222.1 AtpZ/AtpI family protein [Alphaproteobacteria bacterium]